MVDARMLEHLSKKELEKFLGVTRKFHQASIVHGIHLLRMMKYDRQVSTSGKALSYSDFNLFCALGLKVNSQIVRVRCPLDLTPVGSIGHPEELTICFDLYKQVPQLSLCPPNCCCLFFYISSASVTLSSSLLRPLRVPLKNLCLNVSVRFSEDVSEPSPCFSGPQPLIWHCVGPDHSYDALQTPTHEYLVLWSALSFPQVPQAYRRSDFTFLYWISPSLSFMRYSCSSMQGWTGWRRLLTFVLTLVDTSATACTPFAKCGSQGPLQQFK